MDSDLKYVNSCSQYLEETNICTCERVDSGEQALSLLKKNHFDLIISEYNLPDMNVISFLEKIPSQGDIPCIVATEKKR